MPKQRSAHEERDNSLPHGNAGYFKVQANGIKKYR